MTFVHPSIDVFQAVAADPLGYARDFKERTGRRIIGSFPMHFPNELAHAAGALPVIIQESDDPITAGHAGVYPFYCGYTRSVVDQALTDRFDMIDAIVFGDHCVQLLGAADSVRSLMPEVRVEFHQLISSMSDPWSRPRAKKTFAEARAAMERLVGPISDNSLRASIRLFNHGRALVRRLYELRKEGRCDFTAGEMQHIVKSQMVMDREEHNRLLEPLVEWVESSTASTSGRVRVYLSGHFCQAPKLELLELIEDCGGTVVDDDLYHGQRFIATDVEEDIDPMEALANWYLKRNLSVPCPTRVDQNADWETHLMGGVERSRADAMIVLMAKFCEPHMYYYPIIKEAFERRGVPHLLLETEHELGSMEGIRTRVETFLELAKRASAVRVAARVEDAR
jgi:benzoyl-CoA reductase subunit C